MYRDDSDDGEDELEGGVGQEQRQDGAVLRPGEEAVHEDGLHPDDALTAGTKRSRPKLTYEMLTVLSSALKINLVHDLVLKLFIVQVCRPQRASPPYLEPFVKHSTDNEVAEAIQQRIWGFFLTFMSSGRSKYSLTRILILSQRKWLGSMASQEVNKLRGQL